MEKGLINEIKKAINYTEEVNECEKCKYSEEKENPYLDRDWFMVCKVNPLGEFQVSNKGRCDLFEAK